MRKVILYVAMSLDGYLADQNKNVDWIEGDGSSENDSPWYESFYQSIDTILMGRNTYQQIIQDLSFGIWLYGDKKSYIFTSQGNEERGKNKELVFTDRNPKDLIHWLKHRKGKDIWLCGGSDLITQMVEANLIDEYHITLIPTLLGEGIPLFPKGETENKLTLLSSQHENGMVDLIYKKRES